MKKTLSIICVILTTAALAVTFAPVEYVDNTASNILAQAKEYTNSHTPEIDLSAYVAVSNADLRVDSATNIVWKCVWSNGVEYVYAYSNNTNIVWGTQE